MSKFYIVCGSHSLVITAPSADQAALRLIDEVLAPHIWIYDDPDLSNQDRLDHLTLEALLHMEPEVMVSQRGLGRDEAGRFEVPNMIRDWHRLMTGVSRLFVAAGLAPRRVLPAGMDAGGSDQDEMGPKSLK
ncbi:hypothetical protein FF011L_54720 [Roseimaritima multifibrata]|uniref:Uncharacterized protein n=1 Tax=Roseimaritima multifibrata TaxID=1930274 RepID=A0A517MP49_9BACT|nr:hypothetical protein [Roseimaritima multifibrata]QDS96660.1 hypothetical protein FF011L_54720 [Roseimaritima multifibrata]